MATLNARLKALENLRSQPKREFRSMTDAELIAMLGPDFGGRVPTDAELMAIITGAQLGNA